MIYLPRCTGSYVCCNGGSLIVHGCYDPSACGCKIIPHSHNRYGVMVEPGASDILVLAQTKKELVMQDTHVVNSSGKAFTAAELAKIFSRPGIIGYSVITTGFTTSRVKTVSLIMEAEKNINE